MIWLRLLLALADVFNRMFETIKQRQYIREGENLARKQALEEQIKQIQKAREARQRIRDQKAAQQKSGNNEADHQASYPNKPAQSSERLRESDPYQRD